jgi:hypothetical protein
MRLLHSTIVALVLGSAALHIACDDSSSNAVKEPVTPPGAPPGTAPNTPPGPNGNPPGTPPGVDGGDDCFVNPTTHFEIINACTDAQKIKKNPTLAKLLPDGGLPPPQ